MQLMIKSSKRTHQYRKQFNKLNAVGQLCLFGPTNYTHGKNFVRYGNDIKDLMKYVDNKRNWYLSFNSFHGFHRAEDNVLGLNGFFIDCDCQKAHVEKTRFIWDLPELLYRAKLPNPTAIKDSGHGFHLIYWFTNQVIIHNQCINRLWSKIERILVNHINIASKQKYHREIGDMNTTDSSRVLRVVDSWNIKKHPVQCWLPKYNSNNEYDLFNYWVDYLPKIHYRNPPKAKIKRFKRFKKHITIKVKKSKLTLNACRALDLKEWVKSNHYSITGRREEFLFIYSCCAIHCESPKAVIRDVRWFNKQFTEPLPTAEIENLKTEMIHINFKQYRFRSSTIINKLGITASQQEHLKTIMFKSESRRRFKNLRHKRSKKRKLIRNQKILSLHSKKDTYRQIANKLNVSLYTISKVIKHC